MKKTARVKVGKVKKAAAKRGKARAESITIGLAGFAKISAVEGLHLTRDMVRTLSKLERAGASPAERRATIMKKYG